MDVKDWTVCVIEPNRFEREIILDLLRVAGVVKIRAFESADIAADAMHVYKANVVIVSYEMAPQTAPAWARAVRRNRKLACRRSAIFITSAAFSREMAEECRHAGANALIGKPISARTLIGTIKKVLESPRQFVDCEGEGYVGPCRRAGILTAGAPKKRRKADEEAEAAMSADRLAQAFGELVTALQQMAEGAGGAAQCAGALHHVQSYAVHANDEPLMGVCRMLAQQLSAHDLRSELGRAALKVCAKGIRELAELGLGASERRAQVAVRVEQAIHKLIVAKAAA